MLLKDKYISPFTDFGFKKLFGTEPNKDILMDFLNELLKKENEKIVDLTYLSLEQLGRSIDARKAIFDIYCENQKGEKFIVELQKAPQNYFKDRSIYYSTFPIQQQAQKGKWSFKLEAVYTIGILDFIFAEDEEDQEVFHHEVKLVDQKTQKVFYDKLTYIYLEMPKFKKTEEELETHFDKWLYILRNLEDLTKRPEKIQEKIFKKLFEQAEIANYSEQEYNEYEQSLKIYRDLNNVIETAEAKGEKRGKAEGKAEGLVEGEEKGRFKEKKMMATSMLAEGLTTELIMKVTQLSPEEIEQLRSQI
jgi:predicted transposase/invertase (TIGR01784 family)